jgi:LysR family transcriptional regulator, cyn operon transcriptional activator
MNNLNEGMELHQLRCVVAIADHGTFTQAAAALHLSQPALSHAVARLERDLGSRLFERSAAGTRLTEAGRAFLAPARRALAEADSGRAAVEEVAGVLSGELRVALVRTAVVEASRLVLEFHRRHPGVSIVVDEPAADREVADAVRSARCDIGVIHAVGKPADLPGVAAGTQRIVAIFPEALAPTTPTVTLDYLSGMPVIAPRSGTSQRIAHDAFFAGHAKKPPVIAECSDHGVLVELVRGGLGTAICSDSLVAALHGDGIAVRSIDRRQLTELTVIRRPQASPAALAFLAMLLPAPSGRRRFSAGAHEVGIVTAS